MPAGVPSVRQTWPAPGTSPSSGATVPKKTSSPRAASGLGSPGRSATLAVPATVPSLAHSSKLAGNPSSRRTANTKPRGTRTSSGRRSVVVNVASGIVPGTVPSVRHSLRSKEASWSQV